LLLAWLAAKVARTVGLISSESPNGPRWHPPPPKPPYRSYAA
jgi:hypothetical protein